MAYRTRGEMPVVEAGFAISVGSISASVTATASSLQVATPVTDMGGRKTLLIYNNGTATIYIGGANVTVNTGIPLAVGATLAIDVGVALVYGIAASGTHDVRVLEAY